MDQKESISSIVFEIYRLESVFSQLSTEPGVLRVEFTLGR